MRLYIRRGSRHRYFFDSADDSSFTQGKTYRIAL
jgi:hypothetical protein